MREFNLYFQVKEDADIKMTLPYITTLALKDLAHDWKMTICLTLGLAAVLAPLLILFGLKQGVINSLSKQLKENPSNLEIKNLGNGKYTSQWIDDLALRPDVAFVLPTTRTIAASLHLTNIGEVTNRKIITVDLVPTASGDPLLAEQKIPASTFQAVLAQPVAEILQVTKGDKVRAIVSRKIRDNIETENIDLDVLDVLPLYRCNRDAIFVSLNLLVAVEDYRDGHANLPLSAVGSGSTFDDRTLRLYAGYRLYAKSIYDVLSLVTYLKKEGLNVYAKVSEIDMIIKLDKKLSVIFWTLTGIGCVGYFVSLGASAWSNIERKQREINILHLVGFSTQNIIFFPIIQAISISLIGSLIAGFLYFVAQYYINGFLVDDPALTNVICDLDFLHFIFALTITIFFATLASSLAGYKAATLEPNSGLRNV